MKVCSTASKSGGKDRRSSCSCLTLSSVLIDMTMFIIVARVLMCVNTGARPVGALEISVDGAAPSKRSDDMLATS